MAASDYNLDIGSLKALRKNDGTLVKLTDMADLKRIGIYFSAHWCPPCRSFTPQLIQYYNDTNKEKKELEIIFVTSDRTPDDFNKYFSTMPWVALDHGHEDINALKKKYGITGIPTLVFLSKTGGFLTKDGRSEVMRSPDGQ